MSKKNIFLLAAWYFAGWIISSIYSKKTSTTLKKDLKSAKENWTWSFKVLVDNFLDTQTNMIDDVKKEVFSEKNKKLFNEHKEELLEILESYKEKGNILLEELKVKWKDYANTTSEKLEKLYNEKIKEIEELRWVAPEKMDELKSRLFANFKELKAKIKSDIKK